MRTASVHFVWIALLVSVAGPAIASAGPVGVETLQGIVTYENGEVAAGATVVISDAKTAIRRAMVTTDRQGRYQVALPAGNYALALAMPDGYAWIANQAVPDSMAWTVLKKVCHRLIGHVESGIRSARVRMERQSSDKGDTFVTSLDRDDQFTFCLPTGQYKAFLEGDELTRTTTIDLTGPSSVQLTAFKRSEIEASPPPPTKLRSDLGTLVNNIRTSKAEIIGLGEATHGTGELYRYREELTLELVRKLDVRLVLFEVDALEGVEIDQYINGGNVDIDKAITELGFWIIDTREFRKLLSGLRTHNQTARNKVHFWGLDIQNTTPPVNILVADAGELGISAPQLEVLRRMDKRGKGVRDLSLEQRADLDSLLVRISARRSTTEHGFLQALAAKSLALQLGYWIEDAATWHRKKRDAGMAEIAQLIIAHSSGRAVLWAHAAHVSKEPNEPALGLHLANMLGYYAVGFYIYQGSSRAWDEASEIGVIPHAIPTAPPYTLEAALMHAAGMPEVAWVALQQCPPALSAWLKLPRFVREIYATFNGELAMMTLRDVSAGFDAVAIVRTGHDSSPSPTGTRTAAH